MRQLAVYLTRVQPAKLNITWGPIASIFSLAGGSRRLASTRETCYISSSESQNPFARHRVALTLSTYSSLCIRPSVNVARRIVGLPNSARDILCLPIREIAATRAAVLRRD